ncbi:hypothetical protein KKB64_03815 [Patescibacteria group bacterium]|nr:hypothetical protein [Patescibacteria group bacterium]MBU1472884.1 hypothetical protein [Patescibacteria group bacterium]MBU2459785.1 hypothetical protein [Patescibacteria group bacterium]MBU2544806.1 hypothetical protein [Patescibacteria group bacterium]
MPKSGTIIGQITEELGELGKTVVSEAAKVPSDIAGKALESMGSSSGKKQSQKSSGALGQLEATIDENVKKAIARAALEELAGLRKTKPKEPSVWERIQKEEEEKKELALEKAKAAAYQTLPQGGSKQPKGDLYGVKAKRASAEMSRNVRQD